MTESDMIEAIIGLNDIAMSSLMFYLSIVSGYLIAAYAIGKSLTTRQVVYISSLFVVFAIFAIWATVGHMAQSRGLQFQAESIEPYVGWVDPQDIALPMQILGVLGALKFMWDIRHPKTE